jgi:cytochrome c oxidase accessory protein FixG
MATQPHDPESFRDHIGTITADGKRKYLFPKKVTGPLMNARSVVAAMLMVFLLGAPWIRIGGQPLLMINVLDRKFIIFGQIFWPQDFYLLGLAIVTGVVFVILFTVIFGRLFCGWVCPQTIFMEHVFRRIEYWIDGDRGQQLRLNNLPWSNPEKIGKRLLKNGIFLAISFAIANTFLMYVIGTDAWKELVTDPPSEHLGGLTAMVVFTGLFFFVFAWFREQVCIIACPYGRLQGVLLDRNSVVIAYDRIRGENRAKWRKNEDRAAADKGDCIDCGQCVDVCPTGIDIRNGTQLECINCAACIDVCDSVMEKVGLPQKLIKYASESQIADSKPFRFTTRIVAYIAVLVVLLNIMGFLLLRRTEVDATILRAPGQTFQTREDGRISNLYTYKVINKTNLEQELTLQLLSPANGEVQLIGTGRIVLPQQGRAEGSLFLILPRQEAAGRKVEVSFGLYSGEELIETITTNFNGPVK